VNSGGQTIADEMALGGSLSARSTAAQSTIMNEAALNYEWRIYTLIMARNFLRAAFERLRVDKRWTQGYKWRRVEISIKNSTRPFNNYLR
jgi:hypothetical protein